MDHDLETLNQQFGIAGVLKFVCDRGDLVEAVIETDVFRGRVALQGAQVLDWTPKDGGRGEMPVIWTSKQAVFQTGRPVRGGIPVCWPWFGDHPENPQSHGFVRNRLWNLKKTAVEGGNVVLVFTISDTSETRLLWDHAFELTLTVTMGERLSLDLVTQNRDSKPFSLTQGLHTYLHVSDIDSVTIRGLEGYYYLDKLRGFTRDYQDDVIRFAGEFDRIYLGTSSEVLVEDPDVNRVIHVTKAGSHSTVVWNPWADKADAFVDMAREEYDQMVCVEATNAGDDIIMVQPGQSKHLATTIWVRSLY